MSASAPIIQSVPAGIVTRYLNETITSSPPMLWRENMAVFIPIFVREETTEDGGKLYRFFNVPVTFKGQDLDDYAKCVRQCATDIRKFLYGSPAAQGEMRDDHVWENHRQAVRSAFPKYEGETNPSQARFKNIYDAFWAVIDGVLASIGKTRADLPEQPFNAEQMAAWAIDNNVPADVIEAASRELSTISLDLLHNDRNWAELFREPFA